MAPVKISTEITVKHLLEKTIIESASNKQLKLGDIMSDNAITVIDCWATWCMPCREQVPYLHGIEEKYKTKVNFVYLSFDKDETKWNAFLKKNNLNGQQYLINNDFASAFSKYFNIETIPRYILLSKKGEKVLDAKMPFPAFEDDFEKVLQAHLKD